jgi:hypothetical protein
MKEYIQFTNQNFSVLLFIYIDLALVTNFISHMMLFNYNPPIYFKV